MKKNNDETLSSLDLYDIIGPLNNLIAKSINVSTGQILLNSGDSLSVIYQKQIKSFEPDQAPAIYHESLSSSKTIIRNNITLEGSETLKFYCSTPILSKKGDTLGAIIAIDSRKDDLNATEIALFENIAQIAAPILEKHFETQKIKKVFTDFLHKTVHDLKNPFTSIALTAELLKRKADDSKTVNTLAQRIEKANDRIFNNLERLKSAFPIHNSSFKLNVQEIILSQLLAQVKQDFTEGNAMVKNEKEIAIYGDPHRLRAAFTHLLQHLSKLSGINNIHFTLTEKETHTEIAITNYPNENFELSTNEPQSNALSIAKTLIEMHRGKISTAQNPQTGSYCFYISLPLTTP
ncbi:sensor histidine kinase [Pedobacter nanyangensis]|uniref:sensor histidine kinase n=1 Tax=Pedobacter nanyangensis TaxID=1562389 RepID=UPI000DE4FAE8|nr:HAMP domain-containing sensor histidine kinase [Pedobacter nanyangensis]